MEGATRLYVEYKQAAEARARQPGGFLTVAQRPYCGRDLSTMETWTPTPSVTHTCAVTVTVTIAIAFGDGSWLD